MIEKILYTTLTLYLLLSLGHALKCYECEGRHIWNKDCYNLKNSSVALEIDCENSQHAHKYYKDYECVVYFERKIRTNATSVVRGCVSKRRHDYCTSWKEKRLQDGYIVEDCSTCYKDLCNSGDKVKISCLIFLIFSVFMSKFTI